MATLAESVITSLLGGGGAGSIPQAPAPTTPVTPINIIKMLADQMAPVTQPPGISAALQSLGGTGAFKGLPAVADGTPFVPPFMQPPPSVLDTGGGDGSGLAEALLGMSELEALKGSWGTVQPGAAKVMAGLGAAPSGVPMPDIAAMPLNGVQPIPEPPPSPSCFVAKTKVIMSDGSSKNIKDVEVGDKVLGSGGTYNTVVDIETPDLGKRKLYSFNGGELFVTNEHPFMSSDGWKAINSQETYKEQPKLAEKVTNLEVGDVLVTDDGNVEVDTIDSSVADNQVVYNLLLEENNTYYANGYLVHNKIHWRTPTFTPPDDDTGVVGGNGAAVEALKDEARTLLGGFTGKGGYDVKKFQPSTFAQANRENLLSMIRNVGVFGDKSQGGRRLLGQPIPVTTVAAETGITSRPYAYGGRPLGRSGVPFTENLDELLRSLGRR